MIRCSPILAGAWFVVTLHQVAFGDELRLTPEGLKHVDEIEQLIAPASLVTDERGQFIRCLILDAHPGDLVAAPEDLDFWVSYTAVCYDDGGTNLSAPVRLSSMWVRVEGNSIDTFMDLRLWASNRDEIYGTRVGSPEYVAGVLRSLGITRPGLPVPPPDTEALQPGMLELRLRDETPSQGEWMMLMTERIRNRLPLINFPPMPRGGFELADEHLLDSIARARRYGIHESGFARAAMQLVVMRSEFLGIEASSPLATRVAEDGKWEFQALHFYIGQAAPNRLTPVERDVHGDAIDAIRSSSGDEEVVARLTSEYWATKRGEVPPAPDRTGLPVDPSELALVALDVLLVSDAVFRADDFWRRELLRVLEQFGTDIGYDFRVQDAVDPRPSGAQLLHRVLDPEARSTSVSRERVRESAEAYRSIVTGSDGSEHFVLWPADSGAGGWRYRLERMRIAGWVANAATLEAVRGIGQQTAESERMSRDENRSVEQRAYWRRRFECSIQALADMHALSAVEREAEQQVAAEVEAYFAGLRALDDPDESTRSVLARWQELRGR